MNTLAKVAIGAAVVAGVGVAALSTSGYTKDCIGDLVVHCVFGCKLDVTIDSCTPDGIKLSTETLSVCDDRHITWKLDSKDSATGKKYKFAPNGIQFDPAASAVFDPNEKDANKYSYVWRDKHVSPPAGTKISFKYEVNVLRDDDSVCASRDPRISNE